MRVYIGFKDWVDYCICGKQRIIDEFEVNNTTLDKEVQNSMKLAPKKIEVNEQQSKLTLYV